MAKYEIWGSGTITRGWDIGSEPYQRTGREKYWKVCNSLKSARAEAIKHWKYGKVSNLFTEYNSAIIYDEKGKVAGSVNYSYSDKVFWWRPAGPLNGNKRKMDDLFRIVNKDGSLSTRKWIA